MGVSYTFAKALNTNDNGDNALFRAYPSAGNLNKGLAGFDRTHTLQISHYLQLPFGEGRKWVRTGLMSKIVGGFQIGGILSRYSGVPFSIGSPAATGAFGQTQTANQVKPDVTILGGHDPNTPYFDWSSFGNPAANSLGTT